MYATSAAATSVLRGLARKKPRTAAKYFVGSVFWNETVDATYLPGSEHQTEGIVADYSLTPGHCMDIVRELFTKLLIT